MERMDCPCGIRPPTNQLLVPPLLLPLTHINCHQVLSSSFSALRTGFGQLGLSGLLGERVVRAHLDKPAGTTQTAVNTDLCSTGHRCRSFIPLLHMNLLKYSCIPSPFQQYCWMYDVNKASIIDGCAIAAEQQTLRREMCRRNTRLKEPQPRKKRVVHLPRSLLEQRAARLALSP